MIVIARHSRTLPFICSCIRNNVFKFFLRSAWKLLLALDLALSVSRLHFRWQWFWSQFSVDYSAWLVQHQIRYTCMVGYCTMLLRLYQILLGGGGWRLDLCAWLCAVELGIFDEWQHVTNGALLCLYNCAVVVVVRLYTNLELYSDWVVQRERER